jgi:hypothetical protein
MTAEVCLMNRLAVVIAADSATTVTQFTDRGSEERYFKGANKIFQLSDFHPVGLMIFDSADILRTPWELVAKAFRQQLDRKSFNTLEEYAKEFFSFLESAPTLFPSETQTSIFLQQARSAAFQATIRPTVEGESYESRRAENDAIVTKRRVEIDPLEFPPPIDDAHAVKTTALMRDQLIEMIEEWRVHFGDAVPADLPAFAELGILEVLKNPKRHMGSTGLVFAGFGDHEVFPSICEYESWGLLAGRHAGHRVGGYSITHELPAWLGSFAQTDMCDTFHLGISGDVYASLMGSINEGLQAFGREIIAAVGETESTVADFDAMVQKSRQSIGETIMANARREHSMPLRRVLGVLPVDEMAELAETLINLQSLKEKVTKKSETVGGPVDVAIITKNEGLIWVKRKHFFDMSLNSRFAWRQQARLK